MSRKIPGSAIVPGTITVTQITGGLNDTTNASYAQANTARTTANDAYGQANTAYGQANNAYSSANLSYEQANASYNVANTKLASVGGTLSGDLIITGNLTVSGNSTTLNTEVLTVEDAEVVLLSNVAGTPALNAGIIVNRGTSTNTFLRWDEALDEWGWSDSGTTTYYFEDLRAGLATTNTTFGTVNTSLGTINTSYQAAYAQANTAHGTANDAYGQANTAYGQANSAYGAANNRVLKAGDTMTGQLNISSGGLLVTGNVGFGTTAVAQSSFQSSTPVGVFSRDNNAQLRVHRPSAGSGVGAGAVLFAANDGSGNQKDVAVIRSETTATNADGGDLCFWTRPNAGSLTERARIDANGNFGIGTASPSVNLHITQAVASGVGSLPSGTGLLIENTGNNYITLRHSADAGRYSGLVFMDNNIGGYIVHGDGGGTGDKLYLAGYGGVEILQGASNSVTPGARTTIGNFTSTGLTVTGTITETSSIRIKENINPITDALEKVLSMNGYTYDRIDGTAKQRAGLIAEEINEIIPNVVQKDAEGLPYGIQYTNIIAYLVEAIKELKTEINDLKKGV